MKRYTVNFGIISKNGRVGGKMKLSRLLEDYPFAIDDGEHLQDIEVTSVTNDSRKIEQGGLFVAIKGYLMDGHDYIGKASEKGAAAAVVSEFRKDVKIPQIRVENPREALSRLSAKLLGYPTKNLKVIGITATNGKTTTSYMLDHIYLEAGYKTGLIGSVMIKSGDEFVHSELTTPESSDLQKIFLKMAEDRVEKAVMEVSSSALELYRVNDVDFDIVAFNNFSREHIDQHGSLEKYYEAKSSLIRKAKSSAVAVLNMDDENTISMKEHTKARVITFSTKDPSATLFCKNLDLSSGRGRFTLVVQEGFEGLNGWVPQGEYPVSLKVPGFHSVVNALSAMAIAMADGVDAKVCVKAMETFGGVERRFQYIYDGDFIIIDDHFANTSNIDMTLESLVKLEYEKLHLVYAIRGNRGPVVNRENLETLLKWKEKLHMDEIIGTKSVEFVTDKDRVTKEEIRTYESMLEHSGLEVHLYEELRPAIAYAIDKAQKGDVILLAGSQGMDHGARIALEYIYRKGIEEDRESLFSVLRDRVSDMS